MFNLFNKIKHISGSLADLFSLPRRGGSLSGVGLAGLFMLTLHSCIEPPLRLPAEEVLVDMPIVIADVNIVWNIDVDWEAHWYYGWDEEDRKRWGDIKYPTPQDFIVYRYFLGDQPRVPHTDVDKFPIHGTSFRRTYEFGYYDMLIRSDIEGHQGTQVVYFDETDLDNVYATTTITRSISLARAVTNADDRPTALYNQPEIFYSGYPRDIHISRDFDDYDYFDEKEGVWVKHIHSPLRPLVYIYLVQVILINNDDGRVKGISGDCAISAMASGTNINTAHTLNSPCMVYFDSRMKKDIIVEGQRTDIIGGMLTTYGLCDMDGVDVDTRAQYQGSRPELHNYLYVDLNMSGGSVQTIKEDITTQCQSQCHGGVITIYVDATTIPNPQGEGGQGSLFNPKVEDYNELIYDIPM